MTRTPLLLALVAAAALAGCNKQDHTIVAGDPGANDANASTPANVQLPPAIEATKTYRCADNSVVTVDYLEGGQSANIHAKDGTLTTVQADAAGKPMTAAGGYSLDGSATGSTAKIGVPGHPSQSCKA